jgi:large subunit ribosomal protein L6
MSRVGKKPIVIPEKVQFTFDEATRAVKVVGPLGELGFKIHQDVQLEISDGQVLVKVGNEEDSKQRALWGTTQAILSNLVEGVTKGFNQEVELSGVGFKMELDGSKKNLSVYIGYSHPVKVEVPEGIQLDLQKNTLTGKSIDKQLIGNFFTNLHDLKPCDPYKQKGFRFPGRYYLKKVGKKAGK